MVMASASCVKANINGKSNAYTNNRLNKVNNNITFGYVSNANLLGSITRPNGANTTWAYEAQRNLISSVELKKSNNTLSNYAYTNDALGRRTSMSRTGSVFASSDTLSYAYNDRSEVVGATSNQIASYNYAYSFDNIGNRINSTEDSVSKSYTSNQLNQYTELTNPVETPTYDDDGNMLTNGAWTYAWDMENRLISAENDTIRLEFVYDRMSRRIEKKVYQNNILATHLKFLYNGFKLIEERDALNDNAVLRRYTWQPVGFDSPLYVDDVASNARYYYHTDANKNVTELTDSTGATVAHYEYSPFGATLCATGTYAAINPFRFSSEYHDSETDLVYYNYRYYSPNLGRWLSRDPIEERGGWNLYSSCVNGVIYKVDQQGTTALNTKIMSHLSRRGIKVLISPLPGIIHNVLSYSSTIILYDDEKEISSFASSFSGSEIKENTALQKLNSETFSSFSIAKFNAAKKYGDKGIFSLSGLFPSTSWWLGSTAVYMVSIDYQAKCQGKRIFYRNVKIKYEWHDNIDANSYSEAMNKGAFGKFFSASTYSNTLEGTWDLIVDKIFGLDYKVIIRGDTFTPDNSFLCSTY